MKVNIPPHPTHPIPSPPFPSPVAPMCLDAVGAFDGGGEEAAEGRREGGEEAQAQGVDLSLGPWIIR